jgi:glycosyltransferase involved in cell wall biosynthesis
MSTPESVRKAAVRVNETEKPLSGRRILILVENLSVPTDRRVWQEALTLRDAGAEVAVICPRGVRRDTEAEEVKDGIEIHRFTLDPAAGGATGYVREYAQAFWRISRLAAALARQRRFDVVQACNPPDLLLLAALPLKLRGTRFVFDHHDLVPELFQAKFGHGKRTFYVLARLVERLTFALADVVISTNDSYRSLAITRGGKRPEDVFVVRNAPDPERVHRVPRDESLKRGHRFLISYLGAMAPQDGVDHAVRALAHVHRRRDDWHAIFMGDGPALPELRQLSEELGLDDVVEFPGWVDADYFLRVLSTSDVALAPEPNSPFNDRSTLIKIGEYLALGVPIVGFDLQESRVTAGDCALYATPNDEEDFASCVELLLNDPEQRERVASLGPERMATSLSWNRSAAQLVAAYERAVKRRP